MMLCAKQIGVSQLRKEYLHCKQEHGSFWGDLLNFSMHYRYHKPWQLLALQDCATQAELFTKG